MEESVGSKPFVTPHNPLAESLTDPPKPSAKRKRCYDAQNNDDATGEAASEAAEIEDSIEEKKALSPKWEQSSVVEVLCIHADSNSSFSSGFIVGGRKVVTNADSVHNYKQVKLNKLDSDHSYVARVLAIGSECNLALLTVDDDEFWKGVSPVEFGSLPNLLDGVTIVGYPKGWDTLSVTSGIVSYIDMRSYAHGLAQLLCMQIIVGMKLQIPGAPAFNDKGQCVGISLQSLKDEYSEKFGYVIPAPVVIHFVEDYEKSKEYTGFPVLGVEWQKMENPTFRKAMGMTPMQQGIRVTRVDPTAPASQYLKTSDIILKFDGVDIANDGTVSFWPGGRISLNYLVTQKYIGDRAVLEVLRDSKVHKFSIELGTHKSNIPSASSDYLNSYKNHPMRQDARMFKWKASRVGE